MFEPGQVLRFFYLWKRQARVGEESGRKARPVCVVVRTAAMPGVVFLFPITSQLPETDRLSLAISEMECRRAGLDFPCWIVLDEYNRVDSTRPLISSQSRRSAVSVPPSSKRSRTLSRMPLQPEGSSVSRVADCLLNRLTTNAASLRKPMSS